jgi:hypothetical protein
LNNTNLTKTGSWRMGLWLQTRGSQEPVIAHLVFNLTSKVDRNQIYYLKFIEFWKWATQRSFRTYFLNQNRDNVSEWIDISTRGLFQWASSIKIQLIIWSSTKRTSSNLTCCPHDIVENNSFGIKQHCLTHLPLFY